MAGHTTSRSFFLNPIRIWHLNTKVYIAFDVDSDGFACFAYGEFALR